MTTRERPGDQSAIRDLVITDLVARGVLGTERYGVPLQPHNGRDALRDAYEQALDQACYLRQALEERRNPAFLVVRTMQERLDVRDAEIRRLCDLVAELRRRGSAS